MASISYWFLSPSLVLALAGKLKAWDQTEPTPDFHWEDAVVDVAIPALNEKSTIALCLCSLFQQDFPIRKVTVVDDGSTDGTADIVRAFKEKTGLDIELVRRETRAGKTPTVRELCHTSDADALVVLDGDTVLADRNYITRLVQELFKNAGVAATFGEVMPLTQRHRREIVEADAVLEQMRSEIGDEGTGKRTTWSTLLAAPTVVYRKSMYLYLQRVLYDGHLKLFGSQLNPVGCAVAYKTERLRECFDYAGPLVGDNLTHSEDIYIGHFFNWKGYRNLQVKDVKCASTEPTVTRLPDQLYLWSSSFLQSLVYFKDLPLSPLRRLKARVTGQMHHDQPGDNDERRKVHEQYRAPWGEDFTRRFGRPIGWLELLSLFEKFSYPLILLFLLVYSLEAAAITVGVEIVACTIAVFLVADAGTRLRSAGMMLAATPFRFLNLGMDLVATVGYFVDRLAGNRNWRK